MTLNKDFLADLLAAELEPQPPQWWHAYGAELSEGVWQLIVLGPSPKPPEEVPEIASGGVELPYLRSWTHEPSQDEKDALEPDSYHTTCSGCGMEREHAPWCQGVKVDG